MEYGELKIKRPGSRFYRAGMMVGRVGVEPTTY